MNHEEYLAAVAQAAQWAEEYYNGSSPSATDYEYDLLMQRIKHAEEEHPDWITGQSPTQHVGGSVTATDFERVTHDVPMLSIQDVFTEEEVTAFVGQFPDEKYSVEKKIDGLSLSVTYRNSVFVRGETRGDGYIGYDVTENARQIIGIPDRLRQAAGLPEIVELQTRCEVYLPVSEFERINAELEAAEKKTFSNPRNAAAGILRTKDPEWVKAAHLHAFAFNVQKIVWRDERGEQGEESRSHLATLNMLKELGFDIVDAYPASANEVLSRIKEIGESREGLPYWTDGAVVKLDSLPLRERLGNTVKFPRWCVAFKYPPEERDTTVTDIIVQTGRTGVLTPVALFDPIPLCGTTVSRATLHNQGFINKMRVGIGSTIRVIKSGEIIPKVISVPKPADSPFVIQRCPVCGAAAVKLKDADGNETGVVSCPNEFCPAQLSRYFVFFCSRDVMDIEGMGPAVVEKLSGLGILNEAADLYRLGDHADKIKALEGFGAKKVNALLAAIEKSKGNNIDRVLKAFGIQGVGRAVGKVLAERYPDMETIAKLSEDELKAVDGIGEITAQDIVAFFRSENGNARYRSLAEAGVNMKSLTYGESRSDGKLTGVTFVITGTLPSMSREEAKSLIEANGGKCSGSVSKKTSYLLAGDAAGSKLTKARELGVKIISESDLNEMLA